MKSLLFQGQIALSGGAQVIQHCGMHLTFKADTGKLALYPCNYAQRSVDVADFHSDAIANTGKAIAAFDLAPAFGNIDHVHVYRARLHAPFDHKAKGAPFRRSRGAVVRHVDHIAQIGK